ncbi:hypothetical protein L1987_78166 [Smallanthus sonchifolius]|uniref:Uncharacterized protein n=1 Tax=Smallanthus sonchifolius TaxID=185202 RepID=A0ACB8ZBM9_9ASTR|nr:hypothetical protein L1987_78166 [Smallanthus sonchifolius]
MAFISDTHQLQSTQTHIFLQIRKHLEYPLQLRNWGNFKGDFCSLVSSPQVRIKCEDSSISVLKIMGIKLSKAEQEFAKLKKPMQTLERQHVISNNQAEFVDELMKFSELIYEDNACKLQRWREGCKLCFSCLKLKN